MFDCSSVRIEQRIPDSYIDGSNPTRGLFLLFSLEISKGGDISTEQFLSRPFLTNIVSSIVQTERLISDLDVR